MRKILLLALVAAVVWLGKDRFAASRPLSWFGGDTAASTGYSESHAAAEAAPPRFHCDGRTHCSHMRSCEEATYFLRHCPNTKMDGDNDGVPCERQWCN